MQGPYGYKGEQGPAGEVGEIGDAGRAGAKVYLFLLLFISTCVTREILSSKFFKPKKIKSQICRLYN